MLQITKDQFNKFLKERIELEGECDGCGTVVELYEVTEYPASEEPENSKYFKSYCPKCDSYYQIKKSKMMKKTRQ